MIRTLPCMTCRSSDLIQKTRFELVFGLERAVADVYIIFKGERELAALDSFDVSIAEPLKHQRCL